MKKMMIVTAIVAAVCGLGYVGSHLAAQSPGVVPASTGAQPTLKIGVVNITRVIKEFEKANYWGDAILNQAKKYEKELKDEAEVLKGREARLATLTEQQRDAETKALRQLQATLQDKDQEYQKDIRKRRDDMAIEINGDIAYIIDNLARTKGLELVLTCPDVPDAKDAFTLPDAMRRMTAPAVWVAWKHPNMDMTAEVVQYLNHYRKKETIGQKIPQFSPAASAAPGSATVAPK